MSVIGDFLLFRAVHRQDFSFLELAAGNNAERREVEMRGGVVGSVGTSLQLSDLAGNLQMHVEGCLFSK